jgi:DNA-binding transcriptional regulator YiaG
MPKSTKARRGKRVTFPPPSALLVDASGANMVHMSPTLETESSYFADRLRELRQRIVGKQLCLSCAIGCTDAAVSFWESGKRLPQLESLSRILEALARGGASPTELSSLHHSWQRARAQSRVPIRVDSPTAR